MRFWYKLKDIKNNIKYRHQRKKRGFGDYDLFDMTYWFETTFVDMLQEFQKTLHGYPQMEFEEVDRFDKDWKLKYYQEIQIELKELDWYNEADKEDFSIEDDYIKWRLIIKRIIWCFNEANEDKCSIKNEAWDKWYKLTGDISFEEYNTKYEEAIKANEDLYNEWLKKDKEICTYKQKRIKEAFELLSKYYFALWD